MVIDLGIDNTSSNISTIPITILYTGKIYIFLNHNTGIQYWNKFLYQYCDRQVQEIRMKSQCLNQNHNNLTVTLSMQEV